jgi:hypothetical protein
MQFIWFGAPRPGALRFSGKRTESLASTRQFGARPPLRGRSVNFNTMAQLRLVACRRQASRACWFRAELFIRSNSITITFFPSDTQVCLPQRTLQSA